MTEGGTDPPSSSVEAFDRAAAEYERGRPGYPREVATVLARELGLGPGTRVCDLAAGTGKFTRLLHDLGCEVIAVEPAAGMRAQLAEVLPDVALADGSAEATGLPPAAVDVVTAAQAFHWFDVPAALAEIERVLAERGGLAMLWNVRDEDEPWVRRMSEVLDWHGHAASRYQKVDWVAEVAASGRFTPLERESIRWTQPMTRELLDARVRSISYVADLPSADQDELTRGVLALVADHDESFVMPLRTELYWCRRR